MSKQRAPQSSIVTKSDFSRRTFVQGAAVAGIAATLPGVVTSVAAQDATPEASPAASPASAGVATTSITRDEYLAQLREHFAFEDAGATGGQVIYVSTIDMKTVNPAIRSDVAAEFVTSNIFNGLIAISPIDGAVSPDLADYWEVGADGITYTFHLNENATWHDGQPVTADDVDFTFQSVLDPEGLTPWRSDLEQVIASHRAIDAHTFELVSKSPMATFLQKAAGQVGIMPKHIWENIPVAEWGGAPGSTGSDPSQVIGSGPFRFVEWVQNDHATIARNDSYWLPDGVPTIDSFTLRVVEDGNSAVQSVITGEADIIDLAPAQVDTFTAGNPDLTVDVYDTFRWAFIAPNQDETNATFFKDLPVRQALMYALDRQAIVDELLGGYAVKADGTQPVISRAYAPERVTTIYDFDPKRAKSLLEEAGWTDSDGDGVREKDGVKLSMEFPYNGDDATNGTLVTYLQQAWGEVGIEITPTALPQPTLIDRIFANDFQLTMLGITWNEEDQGTFFRTGVGFNLSHWSNAEYDRLNDEQLVELDDAKRMELIIEQSNIVNDELALGILYFTKAATGSNPRIHNLRPNAYGSTWSVRYAWVEA